MDYFGFEGLSRQQIIDAAVDEATGYSKKKKKKKKTKAELRKEAIDRNAKQMMESVKTY